MMREGTFWRYAASILDVMLALSVIINLSGAFEIPRQITLLLFGILMALAVGYSIVNPNASLTRLDHVTETKYRKRQYLIGICVSTFLVALMLVKEIRNSLLVWIFIPIIVLPFVLLIRERLTSGRNVAFRKRKPEASALQEPRKSPTPENE
jgi:hypothetical protein